MVCVAQNFIPSVTGDIATRLQIKVLVWFQVITAFLWLVSLLHLCVPFRRPHKIHQPTGGDLPWIWDLLGVTWKQKRADKIVEVRRKKEKKQESCKRGVVDDATHGCWTARLPCHRSQVYHTVAMVCYLLLAQRGYGMMRPWRFYLQYPKYIHWPVMDYLHFYSMGSTPSTYDLLLAAPWLLM